MIRDEPDEEMTNLNLKVESCLTLLGRNLRILIFIFSGFARVTSHGKICLRALTSGNPSVAGTLCRHIGGE
jgi:hypothetical protein